MAAPDEVEAAAVVEWRCHTVAGLPGCCDLGTVVRKDKADAIEEIGDEDGGVAMRLGAVDPLQQRGANMCR